MQERFEHKDIIWIDFQSPNRHELIAMAKEFGVGLATIDQMLTTSTRPKISEFASYFHIILHFPGDVFGNERVTEGMEIHFLLGGAFLVTMHQEHSDALYTFTRSYETAHILGTFHKDPHGGHLFISLMQHFYRNIADEIDEMNDTIVRVEKSIFNRKEAKMIEVLAGINRSLLVLKKTMQFHDVIFTSLKSHSNPLFGEHFREHLEHLIHEHGYLTQMIQGTKEILDDVKDTGQLLLTNRTNNFIMVLTMVAFITVPISLTSEFIALELPLPFLDQGKASIQVLLAAIGVGLVLLLWSRYKKWI
ncbi:MAG: magnesium transporter [Planctomycetota bacterium]|jgi:magnesium transporter